jgi:hypothetical protein
MRPRTNRSSPPGSEYGIPSTVALLSVAMFGFFAGTLLTLHSGLGKCDGIVASGGSSSSSTVAGVGRELSVDAQVEQLALKRIKGD